MQIENLFYALTQLIHNFGALAVLGGALAGLKLAPDRLATRQKFAWLVFAGWLAQISSGMLFGGISFYYYGEMPDLHAIARVALIIKLFCAATAFMLVLYYIQRANSWSIKARHRAWHSLTGLGATALTAAAFLRWFS